MKQYSDKKQHALEKHLQIGDRVLVKTPRVKKISSYYDPVLYRVTKIKENMVTATRPDRSVTRNITFFKKITANIHEQMREEGVDDADDIFTRPQQQPANQQPRPEQHHRYPKRQFRRSPDRFSNFVM